MSGGHGHGEHHGNKGIALLISIPALVWISCTLGLLGIAFCVIGFWFPTAVHLF